MPLHLSNLFLFLSYCSNPLEQIRETLLAVTGPIFVLFIAESAKNVDFHFGRLCVQFAVLRLVEWFTIAMISAFQSFLSICLTQDWPSWDEVAIVPDLSEFD